MTASSPAPPGIFISYRRKETATHVGWLVDRLAEHFGQDQIFKDIDSIQPGDDFAEVISDAVASCQVLLALIGDRWLKGRRLENPKDFVRLEIEAALSRKIRVIPILVDGAKMPRADQLPLSLAGLAGRQAIELSTGRFHSDVDRLLKVLNKTISKSQTARPLAAVQRQLISTPPASPERLQQFPQFDAGPPTVWPAVETAGFPVLERCIYKHQHADLAFFMAWPQLRTLTGTSLPPGAWPFTVPLSSLKIPGKPKFAGIWYLIDFSPGWTPLTAANGISVGLALNVQGVGKVYARWT